nr:glycosyltransferase [Paenibacillus elgii]
MQVEQDRGTLRAERSPAPLRIMLFAPNGGRQALTGMEKYMLTLIRELKEQAECLLVADEPGVLAAEAGLPVIAHPVPPYHPPAEHGESPDTVIRRHPACGSLVNLLHMRQPDIVLVGGPHPVLPASAAKTLGIPVLWLLTETVTDPAWTSQIGQWIESYADWIVGVSDASLAPLRTKASERKIFLLPPTRRREELNPDLHPVYRHKLRSVLPVEEEHRIVGFAAPRLKPEMGLSWFAAMAVQVAAVHPDVRFLVAGSVCDEAHYRSCRRLIEESGYGSRFHYVELEPHREQVLAAMDLIVVPSLFAESFSMTALDGWLLGKDVITYRSGGLEEMMTAIGNSGLLAPQGDVEALTDCVLKCLETGEQPGSRAEASRRSAEAAYGEEAYRKRLAKLMANVCNRAQVLRRRRMPSSRPMLRSNAVYKGKWSPALFLLERGMKRPFASAEAFRFYRYRGDDIRVVPDAVLNRFPTGRILRHDPPSPPNRPSVMLAKGRGRLVYLLTGGRRLPLPVVSQAALRQRGLDPTRVVLLPSDELHAMPLGKALQGPGDRRRSPKGQRRRYPGSKQAGWAIDDNPVRGRRLKSRKHSRARP